MSNLTGQSKTAMGSNKASWWFQPLLKNISQNGNLPQIGVKIKHIWNHHPERIPYHSPLFFFSICLFSRMLSCTQFSSEIQSQCSVCHFSLVLSVSLKTLQSFSVLCSLWMFAFYLNISFLIFNLVGAQDSTKKLPRNIGHNAAAKDTTKSPNNQFFAVPVLQQTLTGRIDIGSQQGALRMMVWKRNFRLERSSDLGVQLYVFGGVR